jgi:DNA-binding MarR family transcriptional regulator
MADLPEPVPLAIALVSEITAVEQMLHVRLGRMLPRGMELSHFAVLNHLAGSTGEKTPAQLARLFHVTKGAMTNTLKRLETAGHIHVRPDWDDGRRKLVMLSPAGLRARQDAIDAVGPALTALIGRIGEDAARGALPALRRIRQALAGSAAPTESAENTV